MGEWTLQVGAVKVVFLTTKEGALGVRFNKSKEGGAHYRYFAPGETKKELPLYDPKNPQKDFVDVRYKEGDNYYRADQVQRKYYDRENTTVYITADEMQRMYPLTKEAKGISKQPMERLDLSNISASDGYYLLPLREYENIIRYKKLIEYIGEDFIITNPVRLRVGSVTAHNYAIFVDKRQNALVAMEVLVKAGQQPAPNW